MSIHSKFSSQVTIFSVTWLLSFFVYAEEASEVVQTKNISAFTNWPIILLVLIGMIGLILALAWFVKRFGGMSFSGNREMKVVTSIPLGARERIALIDIKGQQFLLGVTTQQISHLHTFNDAVIPLDVNKKTPNQTDFVAKLQSVLGATKINDDLDNTKKNRDGHES